MIKSTAQTIAEAALTTLREEGFAGASSRAIARRGGFNQALIFYHYGSLDRLLVAALERSSTERLTRYREVLGGIDNVEELVRETAALYQEDRASGHMTVVSQLVAGSLTRTELAADVRALMRPWLDLAEETIERVLGPTGIDQLVPPRELAYAAVTAYLGVNLMANLAPDDTELDDLFARGAALAPLLSGLLADEPR